MPRVHGDGFIHIKDVNFIIPHDEPILEYVSEAESDTAQQIGKYVSRLIGDGETIQVGYGTIPNAILSNLRDKKHLGVHTELLTEGIVELMNQRVIDNTKKSINPGKTVAAFCMGKRESSGHCPASSYDGDQHSSGD
jgi:acyl-CoA hydrolase